MIKRETYMNRIRPFIGNELIKVLTGIRRSGKSVMLDLIQDELAESGVDRGQFISLNFENMSNAHLCTAAALHGEILRRANKIGGKVYLFSTRYRRLHRGKNVSTPSEWNWTAIFISPALTPDCFPASLPHTWPAGMWNL